MQMNISRRICVAPMMDWTDRHCRYFLRLLSKHTLLYTEMITAKALIHGNTKRLLQFNPSEHPIALQLGGNDVQELMQAARLGEQHGYDEINLNVGCPSNRVQRGQFGVCLMLQPELVRDCVAAMQVAVHVPVTVKCRIGVDRQTSYQFLKNFVLTVAEGGCQTFIIHARNAWLNGLSAKENRHIPPLRYDLVYRLKEELPQLQIVINGGIKTHAEIDKHLSLVDGVMLGRAIYHDPYLLSEMDRRYFVSNAAIHTREKVIEQMLCYIKNEQQSGVYLSKITRHMLGLFQGQPGAKQWRRALSTLAVRANADKRVVQRALAMVNAEAEKQQQNS